MVILGFDFLWNRYKSNFVSEPPPQAKNEVKAQNAKKELSSKISQVDFP